MKIPIFIVDAFSSRIFSGNPAAVCPLDYWLDDGQLQSIASENNLSETAFIVNRGGYYQLRWFTPQREVDICGHATLAGAFVLMNHIDTSSQEITFGSRSGELIVKKDGDLYAMNFPSHPPCPCKTPADLVKALESQPQEVLASNYYLVVYKSEDEVRELNPYMKLIKELDRLGVIVTAPGKNIDFVSRFFAPAVGIPEDPVTGSAHCTLIPYWSKRLNKKIMQARQVSNRGGEIFCEDLGKRVIIAGRAVLYSEGVINI
jgi:PhzF family phenazine biosynthesis protein